MYFFDTLASPSDETAFSARRVVPPSAGIMPTRLAMVPKIHSLARGDGDDVKEKKNGLEEAVE